MAPDQDDGPAAVNRTETPSSSRRFQPSRSDAASSSDTPDELSDARSSSVEDVPLSSPNTQLYDVPLGTGILDPPAGSASDDSELEDEQTQLHHDAPCGSPMLMNTGETRPPGKDARPRLEWEPEASVAHPGDDAGARASRGRATEERTAEEDAGEPATSGAVHTPPNAGPGDLKGAARRPSAASVSHDPNPGATQREMTETSSVYAEPDNRETASRFSSRGSLAPSAPKAEPAPPTPRSASQHALEQPAPSSELRSFDGDASASSFPPEIITKKYVYDTLCEWETQRLSRHEELNQLLDPLISGLTLDIQVAKISNEQLWRYIKDRIKLNRDNVQRLRSLAGTIAKTEQQYPARLAGAGASPHDSDTGRTSGDSQMLGNPKSSDKEVRSAAAYSGRLLNILTVPWIAELHNNCLSEADYVETFSEVIDSDIVQGKVVTLTEEFDKATAAILTRTSELRGKLKSQQRDTAKSWQDVQKHFRDTEKAQRKRLDQANANGQRVKSERKTSASPASTHRDIAESDMDASAGGTVKEHRDTWLAERRYFHTAVAFLQMQRVYFYSVKKAISELAQLETWRTVTLRDALLHYLAAGREALGATALSLGRVHTAVDANDFQKQKAAFFARTSPATSPTSHHTPVASAETALASGEASKQPNVAATDGAPTEGRPGDSAEEPTEPAQPNDAPESTYASTSYRHVLDNAQHLVTGGEPPEPRLIIKLGHVKRQTGLFGRWSEGILVLTWDRFLHMFRSHDDVHPLWTVSMTAVEVRVIDEKTGLRTVEIRDKQNLFAVLGQRSFRFRALYETDLSNWLRCLTLASTADDRAFRAEGIAQARASDVSVPLNDYTPWTAQDALEDIPDTQSIESGHLSVPSCAQ